MNKKAIVLGAIAAILAVLVVAVALMCRAPGLRMDGTYTAEDGSTLTVQGHALTSSDPDYCGTVEMATFNGQYIFNHRPGIRGSRFELGFMETEAGIVEVIFHEDGVVTILSDLDTVSFYAD